ncbi:hypothetical protein BD626DRAFT_523469 [Schizophyllum amplum]|uniref:Uncharacterized protein n=1 Tax=Schizophyllum amplum TaxID=97359 RepID=A0A550BT15_9AGAR|nr:hypothetical protein BD626DRAFT_523469 [Auriculariopsis ampla]
MPHIAVVTVIIADGRLRRTKAATGRFRSRDPTSSRRSPYPKVKRSSQVKNNTLIVDRHQVQEPLVITMNISQVALEPPAIRLWENATTPLVLRPLRVTSPVLRLPRATSPVLRPLRVTSAALRLPRSLHCHPFHALASPPRLHVPPRLLLR